MQAYSKEYSQNVKMRKEQHSRPVCGHVIYSTLTQLYRYSTFMQDELRHYDAKSALNEICKIKIGGPRQAGWDRGLAQFIESEVAYYSNTVVLCPNLQMARTLELQIDSDMREHSDILITSVSSSDLKKRENVDTLIFHNYDLMKKSKKTKQSLKDAKKWFFPILARQHYKYIFEIC